MDQAFRSFLRAVIRPVEGVMHALLTGWLAGVYVVHVGEPETATLMEALGAAIIAVCLLKLVVYAHDGNLEGRRDESLIPATHRMLARLPFAVLVGSIIGWYHPVISSAPSLGGSLIAAIGLMAVCAIPHAGRATALLVWGDEADQAL